MLTIITLNVPDIEHAFYPLFTMPFNFLFYLLILILPLILLTLLQQLLKQLNTIFLIPSYFFHLIFSAANSHKFLDTLLCRYFIFSSLYRGMFKRFKRFKSSKFKVKVKVKVQSHIFPLPSSLFTSSLPYPQNPPFLHVYARRPQGTGSSQPHEI